MATSTRIQVILTDDVAETLQILARVEKRSLSNLCSRIIEDYLSTPEVTENVKLAELKAQITNERIRGALEGANLSHDKLQRLTQILLADDESAAQEDS